MTVASANMMTMVRRNHDACGAEAMCNFQAMPLKQNNISQLQCH